LELSLRGTVDVDFQMDLMVSSINGYYFTRMLDDIMDDHPVDRAAMPALHRFHTSFIRPYQRYFGSDSPFWEYFERSLMVTVEAAAAEAGLTNVTGEDFLRISARKPAAAVIPLAAVCVRCYRADRLGSWEDIFHSFARWHQMRDDFLDWSADHKAGHPSWILTEAARRRENGEGIPAWMAREGFAWIKAVMAEWMDETLHAAAALNSPELLRYLNERNLQFCRHIDNTIAQAAVYRQLLGLESLATQPQSANR
jgi:hypothetical protein